MADSQFTLPDVGEGLIDAEIVSWRVQPGDRVALNQVIVEIETAKSLVELPSPFEGTVSGLLVQEGQTVEVGTPIIAIAQGSPGVSGPAETPAQMALPNETVIEDDTAIEDREPVAPPAPAAEETSGAVLVGYGTVGKVASRRRRAEPAAAPARPGASSPAAPAARAPRPASVPAASAVPIIAKPPIRKLAKDLEVDLAEVEATGLVGEITREDVIRTAQQASVFKNIETPEWPDAREDRIPVKGVRKVIAAAMVQSAFQAPHVSLFVDVDATRTMEFVKRLKASPDFAGVKVSPLLIMAKAMIWAVRRNPTVNSSWTDQEIIVRHYVNLGVAAATPRGLVVPNVKESQAMSLLELARALEQLTLTARDGKTSPADMSQGTITLTNIGVFGMDTGTPILNPGEVAIVALGTIKQKPWVVDGEVRPRFVTTIGASFDHRVVDGDVASRFLADVASIIEEPALLLE
ncbi:2-oxo acid dehydrogenase subunit E2 [Clavibacter tessellarius]|uniref:Dihydrolipoamide acetyltransferase component of pyruvate dehydrogenase complex n=1 Tax=Clavibacter tessellarius TaxID=31965 RepID=A0A225CLA5_9MICO|nr:dihydrolipoamide acetyltransferase family protein [Clavibacter michiganensis]OQJ62522.1 branched-chain alpha-keto acid dehydrogenase subunit E2 [Clavibacter michiganensis subsp. tessellarius]UKF34489.1 2-oxo acid dehydrogenase subunit E2 [Clavibacter michiganensis subsp. tessellarius]